jgi:hypothetical protein
MSAIDFTIPLLAKVVAGSAKFSSRASRGSNGLHRLIDPWLARRLASCSKVMDLQIVGTLSALFGSLPYHHLIQHVLLFSEEVLPL